MSINVVMCFDEKQKSKKTKRNKQEKKTVLKSCHVCTTGSYFIQLRCLLLKVHQGKGTKAIVGHGTKEKNVKGIPKTIHILDPRLLPFNDCHRIL